MYACMDADGRCELSTGCVFEPDWRDWHYQTSTLYEWLVSLPNRSSRPKRAFGELSRAVAPAHPGQDHQADYHLAASAADRQAYCPNGRRVPRHGSTRSPTTVASAGSATAAGCWTVRQAHRPWAGLSRLKDLEPAEPARRSAACSRRRSTPYIPVGVCP